MQRLSSTVLKNSAWVLMAQLAIKVLSFVFSVFIVRRLGAEEFGKYGAIMAFTGIFAIISDLGLSPYLVRAVAQSRDTDNSSSLINSLFSNVIQLRLWLSVLAWSLIIATAWLTGRSRETIIAIAAYALILFLYSIQGTSEAVLSGHEHFAIPSRAKIVNQLVFIVLGALVLTNGLGYRGLILANIISVSVLTLICWHGLKLIRLKREKADPSSWPTLLRASLPFGILGFSLGLSYKFDTVLLSIFRGDAATGYYTAAYNLIFSLVILSNVINTSLYPSLSRQAVNNPQSLPQIYSRAFRYLMIIALPIAIGGWALSDQLILFLYQSDYSMTAYVFKILVWVVPFMFASEFLGYVVLINKREKIAARATVVSTAFNVTANLILVPLLGLLGASIMTVITEMVLVGQYIWALRDSFSSLSWARILIRPLVASTLMGVFVVLGKPYISFWINAIVGAGIYFILLIVSGAIGRDEIRFIQNFTKSNPTIT